MKINNINNKNLDAFFKTINECKGKVEIVTSEGDRLNLKSQLSKYVSLAKLFSDGKMVEEIELVIYQKDDIDRLIDFVNNNK